MLVVYNFHYYVCAHIYVHVDTIAISFKHSNVQICVGDNAQDIQRTKYNIYHEVIPLE